MNEFEWINKKDVAQLLYFFICLYLLYFQWTISYLYIIKNGCLNCTMVLSQLYHILVQLRQSWDKKQLIFMS